MAEEQKPRKLSKLFAIAAESASRGALTTAVKTGAVAFATGMGVTAVSSASIAIAAAGVTSFTYSYLRDTLKAHKQAKQEGTGPINFLDRGRAKKATFALLAGVAGGALGAWVADTDWFKDGCNIAKEYGGHALQNLSDKFNWSSWFPSPPIQLDETVITAQLPPTVPAEPPVLIPEADTTVVCAPDPDAPPTPLQSTDTTVPICDPADAATALIDTPLPQNPLEKLSELVAAHDGADKIEKYLQRADITDMDSVSPQFLKDRAHEVLRLHDLPWEDRSALARELAEAAQERGNKQATPFLEALARMDARAEKGLKPLGRAVAAKVEDALPDTQTLVSNILKDLNYDTAPPNFLEPEPLAAAECAVTSPTTPGAAFNVACTVQRDIVTPGDGVACFMADKPDDFAISKLGQGSVDVPTEGFLRTQTVSDCIKRLNPFRLVGGPAS